MFKTNSKRRNQVVSEYEVSLRDYNRAAAETDKVTCTQGGCKSGVPVRDNVIALAPAIIPLAVEARPCECNPGAWVKFMVFLGLV